MNLGKTAQLWIWETVVSRTMLFLMPDTILQSQANLVHNFGVLLNLQLLEELMAVMTRKSFTQLWVMCQLHLFLDWGFYSQILVLQSPPDQIIEMHATWAALEEYAGASAATQVIIYTGTSKTAHVIPLIHKLYWLPVCFCIQMKMLVIILHGKRGGLFEELPLFNYIYSSHKIQQEGHTVGPISQGTTLGVPEELHLLCPDT